MNQIIKKATVAYRQHHEFGNVKYFITEFYLFYYKAPAQRLALNATELVTSRLSAEEVNREPSVRRAQRV